MITVGETYLSDVYDVLNGAGVPTTGTTVTVEVTLPDLSSDSTPAVETAPGSGSYTFAYTTGIPGRHAFSVKATQGFLGSTVLDLGGDVFNVDPASGVAAALVGLAEAKEFLQIERDDDTESERLRSTIATASQLVEAETRVWHRCTVVEELTPARSLVLSQLPVVSVTSMVQIGSDPIDVTSFETAPGGILEPLYGVWPWVGWPNSNKVVVTYEAGEEYCPPAVRHAVLLTVEALWSSTRGPAGLPLASEDTDGLEMAIAYALPADAQKILEPWRKAPAIA